VLSEGLAQAVLAVEGNACLVIKIKTKILSNLSPSFRFFFPLPYAEESAPRSLKVLMEQPRNNKTSQEQARESLIEISYTSPEEDEVITYSDVKPVTYISNGSAKGNKDDAEKLRDELISISYDESPSPSPDVDVAVSPTLPNGVCRG
jgi:hypothetical protein